MTHDLLIHPLLSARAPSGTIALTLPGLLARLGAGEPTEMLALQAHQHHAWHAFLVQLAAMALHLGGRGETHLDEDAWRSALIVLAGGRSTAFQLVVDDLTAPAFLQPPVPENTILCLPNVSSFMDVNSVDVLDTAKSHDVKSARIGAPKPEHWFFALVSLQTMQGYSGSKNYGISRMNGGAGSRSAVGVLPSLDSSAAFRRDLVVAMEQRSLLVKEYGYPHQGGVSLLWLEPWNGRTSLPIEECDPFYVEVCRRIRLAIVGSTIVAHIGMSDGARIDAKARKGDTGDLWTPILAKEAKALTIAPDGFSYKRLQELLLGDEWKPGAALVVREQDGLAPAVVARALVRFDNKTHGFHERIIPIPPAIRSFFMRSDARKRLGDLARARVERAATARLRVLQPAVLQYLQGAPATLNFKDKRIESLGQDFDRRVDQQFFSDLFADVSVRADEADAHWDTRLLGFARTVLEHALRSLPTPIARRYRAISAAETTFWRAARTHLPNAFPRET